MTQSTESVQPDNGQFWAEEALSRSACYRRTAFAQPMLAAGGQPLPERFNPQDAERAKKAGVLDLSGLLRAGYRGAGTPELLGNAGLPIPARPNLAAAGADGDWVLRLSNTEYWLLGSLANRGETLAKLPGLDACDSSCLDATPDACYPLFCMDSHGWLMLTGEHVSDVMAKLCGVDLREDAFPVGSIAQTSLARINGIIVHQEINGLTAYSILCDNASTDYLWTALIDAVQEFDGGPVGLASVVGQA